ncbi:MAG: DUF3843 family protein [Bacteroidales bacterium]|nr:DUF3843 family protein [Bacteroidales bacterium]
MKKIYPIEWKHSHPKKMATKTDRYYTDIANKVLNILSISKFETILPNADLLRDMALSLTLWFEDICSNLGFWKVATETFQKRYGKPLPFYDTSEYYQGEPNPQDIQLLLWDMLQAWQDDEFINPESSNIILVAKEIYKLFQQEYEYAPETQEMQQYLANPLIGVDYWQTRQVIEWLSTFGYFNMRSQTSRATILAKILEESNESEDDDEEYYQPLIYSVSISHTFNDRHNLLSITTPEWLSAAINRPFTLDTTYLKNKLYSIGKLSDTTLQLQDETNKNIFPIEIDSFTSKWFKEYKNKQGCLISCGIVKFNEKYYQCGMLISDIHSKDNILKDIQEQEYNHQIGITNNELFKRVSNGMPILFMKGVKETMDFYTKKVKFKKTIELEHQVKNLIYNYAENHPIAIMGTKDQGFLTITSNVPAINAPNNPYYNADFAKKHALCFFIDPNVIDYEAACLLSQLGYLSDATISSSKGYEYGRNLLQNNAQFVLDYMFAEHL